MCYPSRGAFATEVMMFILKLKTKSWIIVFLIEERTGEMSASSKPCTSEASSLENVTQMWSKAAKALASSKWARLTLLVVLQLLAGLWGLCHLPFGCFQVHEPRLWFFSCYFIPGKHSDRVFLSHSPPSRRGDQGTRMCRWEPKAICKIA